MRKAQLDDDPRLQGIDAHRAGSAFKDDDGKSTPDLPVFTSFMEKRSSGSTLVVRDGPEQLCHAIGEGTIMQPRVVIEWIKLIDLDQGPLHVEWKQTLQVPIKPGRVLPEPRQCLFYRLWAARLGHLRVPT